MPIVFSSSCLHKDRLEAYQQVSPSGSFSNCAQPLSFLKAGVNLIFLAHGNEQNQAIVTYPVPVKNVHPT
jgi:hypothetical protein